MPENSPPTREQAAELAARFLAVCPHQPRMLTTSEAKQAQIVAEALRTAPDPHDLALGLLVDRLLEGLFAVSGEVYSREAQLRHAHAELQRLGQPTERQEQAELLARFASHVLEIPGVLEEALDRSKIPAEDLHAAISELLPAQ